MKNDALTLCNDKLDEVAENANPTNGKDEAKDKAYKLKNGAGLARLPLPLSLMNRREKLAYLRYVISYDRYLRLGDNTTRIKAGDKTWEPRLCPNNIIKWSDLKVNI